MRQLGYYYQHILHLWTFKTPILNVQRCNKIYKDTFVIRNKSKDQYDDISCMRKIRFQQYDKYDIGLF